MIGAWGLSASASDEARLDELFAQLKDAEAGESFEIARDIELELSKSGSATLDLLHKRGKDALEAGRTDAAIEHLTALTDHAPDFADAYYLRAVAFMQADLIGPAFGDVEQALTLNPRHFLAIELLGVLLEMTEKPDLAHDAFARVLDLHPNHKDATQAIEYLKPRLSGETL